MNTRTQYTSTKISVGEKTVESRGVHTTIFFSRFVENVLQFFFLEFLFQKTFGATRHQQKQNKRESTSNLIPISHQQNKRDSDINKNKTNATSTKTKQTRL